MATKLLYLEKDEATTTHTEANKNFFYLFNTRFIRPEQQKNRKTN